MYEELWRRYKYKEDINAREELIIKCLPLVKSLAMRFSIYAPMCCDLDDLISAGVIGLMDALEKYDPDIQTGFQTYARCRIRGAILDEIRSLKWAPRSIQEKMRDLKKVYNRLENTLSRLPTEEEISQALGMDLEYFRKMLIQIGPATILISGQKQNENEETIHYEAFIEDTSVPSPIEQVITEEMKSILADTIKSLPKKETIVISLYYYEEMTMKEIGEVLYLTESRVCQIHASAILNLFRALNSR